MVPHGLRMFQSDLPMDLCASRCLDTSRQMCGASLAADGVCSNGPEVEVPTHLHLLRKADKLEGGLANTRLVNETSRLSFGRPISVSRVTCAASGRRASATSRSPVFA